MKLKKAFLGLDVGNGTIKGVLLDENKKIISSSYQRNRGIMETLGVVLKELKRDVDVQGVCITGAGRNLVTYLIGGDLTKPEIIAHALGTLHYYPNIRTIFEIGANDNKLIWVEKGIIKDFSTQSLCASGTGGFLETIANKLGIKIDEFANYALKSKNSTNVSGKCTVFAMSNVVAQVNLGHKKEDILMGVAKALIRNYIAMLSKNKKLEPPYAFQGGVSKNKAVIKVLEEYLKHKVHIPPHGELMGAVGSAISVLEDPPKKTNFKGFDIAKFHYKTSSFICKKCENGCEITRIKSNKKVIGYLGSLCGIWK